MTNIKISLNEKARCNCSLKWGLSWFIDRSLPEICTVAYCQNLKRAGRELYSNKILANLSNSIRRRRKSWISTRGNSNNSIAEELKVSSYSIRGTAPEYLPCKLCVIQRRQFLFVKTIK